MSPRIRACPCPHALGNIPAQHRTHALCHSPGRAPGPCCQHPAPATSHGQARGQHCKGCKVRESSVIYFWASAESLCNAQRRKILTAFCFFTAAKAFLKSFPKPNRYPCNTSQTECKKQLQLLLGCPDSARSCAVAKLHLA